MRLATIIFALLVSTSILNGQTTTVLNLDFEGTGASTAYTVNNAITPGENLTCIAANDYWGTINIAAQAPGISYTGISGNFYFGAQDTDSCVNASDDLVTVTAQASITGCTNLQFSGDFGEDVAVSGIDWDITTSVRVLATGTGMTAPIFAIEGASATIGNQLPRVDTNNDGVGDGAIITDIMTSYPRAITGTGTTLTLQFLIQDLDTSDEDIAIDNVTVTGDNCTPLPVEMSELKIVENESGRHLVWQTFTETDNAGFEIESLAHGQFQQIGFVEGAGTSQDSKDYSFELSEMTPGRNEFRIRQVDFDGAFEYSNVVETISELPNSVYLSEAYPNPFNPRARFDFVVSNEQDVQIELLDLSGRVVKRLFEGHVSANDPIGVTIDASDLPSGLYYYRLSGSLGHQAMQSVVLMK